jgi:hypothetical protein
VGSPWEEFKEPQITRITQITVGGLPDQRVKGHAFSYQAPQFPNPDRRSKRKELRALHEHPVCFAHGSDPPQTVICVICVIRGYSTSVIRGACSSASIRVHLRLWLDQRFAEHFVDGAYGTKLKTLFRFRGHFFEVFFVGFREEHEVDTGA